MATLDDTLQQIGADLRAATPADNMAAFFAALDPHLTEVHQAADRLEARADVARGIAAELTEDEKLQGDLAYDHWKNSGAKFEHEIRQAAALERQWGFA